MGKPSRLKARQEEVDRKGTPFADERGKRKLYDRDKPPEGTDADVWHLALLFEQLAEKNYLSAEPRPILYTELSHRINAEFREMPDWLDIAEAMIDRFWYDCDYNRNFINNFCSHEIWEHYKTWVIDSQARKELLATGSRVPEESRKTTGPAVDPNEVVSIMTQVLTEEEIDGKLRSFRDKHESG